MPVMNPERLEARISTTQEKRNAISGDTPEARRARKFHKRAQRKLARLKATREHQANRVKKKD